MRKGSREGRCVRVNPGLGLGAERAVQLELALTSGWGGRRVGAGRRPAPWRRRMPHHARPAHRAEHPVHVTLRSVCRSLRTQFVFPTVRNAILAANRAGAARFGVVEFSVQGDHLHLLVEARDCVRRGIVISDSTAS